MKFLIFDPIKNSQRLLFKIVTTNVTFFWLLDSMKPINFETFIGLSKCGLLLMTEKISNTSHILFLENWQKCHKSYPNQWVLTLTLSKFAQASNPMQSCSLRNSNIAFAGMTAKEWTAYSVLFFCFWIILRSESWKKKSCQIFVFILRASPIRDTFKFCNSNQPKAKTVPKKPVKFSFWWHLTFI